jgi:hypothetical protein
MGSRLPPSDWLVTAGAFGRSRPAADAGAMQIQSWEGAALSGAETVLQGTTHDTVRAEIGYGEKYRKKVVEEGERFGLTARHRVAERLEVPRVFELERVESITSTSTCFMDVRLNKSN